MKGDPAKWIPLSLSDLSRFGLGRRIDYPEGILHTKRNEYDSIIKPLTLWLKDKGVTIKGDCAVYDIDPDKDCNTAEGIRMRVDDKEECVEVCPEDYVLVTNGSLMTDSTFGDNTHVAPTNRRTEYKPGNSKQLPGLYYQCTESECRGVRSVERKHLCSKLDHLFISHRASTLQLSVQYVSQSFLKSLLLLQHFLHIYLNIDMQTVSPHEEAAVSAVRFE